MELTFDRVEAPAGVTMIDDDGRWLVANDSARATTVRSVARVYRVETSGALRMFRHGYQSWSFSGTATFGVDADPSAAGSRSLVRTMHHADESIAAVGELRSELVTVLADEEGAVVAGADGGDRHDTTFRLRPAAGGGVELWCEAFLGDLRLDPGKAIALHDILTDRSDDPQASLAWWAASVGRRNRARIAAPYQLGWCSWYQYFHDVSEQDLRHNLALAGDWPFEVFQLDDGYQAAVGDWLTTNDKFPTPLDQLATDIAARGLIPGIWIAPFTASPDSEVAQRHPDWLAERKPGRPLIGMVHEMWGGPVMTLDTSHPDVLDHLETLGRALVERGYRYLKLDFTYAPSIDGIYHDPTMTPAERVRAGYDAVRRGAGDEAFILGCGAPLGACIGVVDGMRIGADVAPWWTVRDEQRRPPGYEGNEPATANAWQNTLSRAFQHRRLWLNDPDCLMLRPTDTELPPVAAESWARAVGVSGGMALVSDDLGLLDAGARRLLDDVVASGRAADQLAQDGQVAVCPDLLARARVTELRGPAQALRLDPASLDSELSAT